MEKASVLNGGIPTTMGRYHILGRIAAGGMAEVFLAKFLGPSGFERALVIKRILPHLASQEEFVDMFLDEARLAAAIRHRNVVQVTELCHEADELFIAMEYLAGETLSALFRTLRTAGKRLNAGLCAHIIAEACGGLHAAHELTNIDGQPLGVVHRDISPQNIFITYNGTVKILDFGVAKAADRITDTSTGQMKGKFSYMAPEQCLREPVDRRTDIFSLGTVLYEISTGQRLFAGDNPIQSLEAICRLPIPKPSERAKNYPQELEDIVMKALDRDREKRFQSAADMRRALAMFVSRSDLPGLPEELLAAQMQNLFASRMAEKEEMLRRVRAGSKITYIPDAQRQSEMEAPADQETVSASVVEPDILEPGERSGVHIPQPPEALPKKKSSFMFMWLMLLLAAGTGAYLWWQSHRQSGDPVSLPRKTEAPAAVDTPEPQPTAPASVTLSIVTEPSGAAVEIDGSLRGTTPFNMDFPKQDQSQQLKIAADGYESLERQITLDADLRLDIVLKKTKSQSKTGSEKPRVRRSKPAEDDEPKIEFERFN